MNHKFHWCKLPGDSPPLPALVRYEAGNPTEVLFVGLQFPYAADKVTICEEIVPPVERQSTYADMTLQQRMLLRPGETGS